MRVSKSDYFVTGGTLSATADCYVTRQADTDLAESLLRNELCYVLSSRQMGKSSLMVRTAATIRANGGHAVLFDLTAIGTNVTPEQWYLGMLCQFGDLTGQIYEVVAHWNVLRDVGPLQRFVSGLRHISQQWPSGQIVIFIDEIDVVTLLPFSTDEFFAAIRECHNRKSTDDVLGRLTFCLLGVAVPSDLIQDPASTPFNIGRRIVLTDFSLEEAKTLEAGLERTGPSSARKLMARVLYWTGGHPYMTQRLCAAILANTGAVSTYDVDRLCSMLFMQPAARDSDPNLAFAQRCLLAYALEHESVIPIYNRILLGEQISLDESDEVHNRLLLSGAVRQGANGLEVRNRVYAKVFDRAWVRTQLPRSEIQVQRFVYLRGLRRGVLLTAYTVLVLAAAMGAIYTSRRDANVSRMQAKRDADRAYRVAYDYRFVAILDRMKHTGLSPGLQALERTMPPPGKTDLRQLEWYYLDKVCHQGEIQHSAMPGAIGGLTWSKQEPLLTYSSGNALGIWDASTRRDRSAAINLGHVQSVSNAMSPDGRLIAIAGQDGPLLLYSTADRKPVATPGGYTGHTATVNSVAFSHNGRLLVSGSADGTARIWDVASGKQIRQLPASGRLPKRGIWRAIFSPDDSIVATAGDDGAARLWRVSSGKQISAYKGHTSYVHSLDFSPDGRLLATAGGDHALLVWDVSTGRQVQRMFGHTSYIYDVAFSPDCRSLASCGWDKSVRIWNVATGDQTRFIATKTNAWVLAYSSDGHWLAAGTSEGDVHVYDAQNDPVERTLEGRTGSAFSITISKDDRRVISCLKEGGLSVWNTDSGRLMYEFHPNGATTVFAASQDGSRIARCNATNWALLDAATGLEIRHGRSNSNIKGARLSSDGSKLVTLGIDCTLWDANSGRVLDRWPTPPGYTLSAFSSDASMVAFQDKGLEPHLYDIRRGHRLIPLTGAMPGEQDVEFSPDSRTFMSKCTTVILWDARTGKQQVNLPDLDGLYIPAALTRNNTRLVYGTVSGQFRLWDLTTNQAVMELPDLIPGANRIAVSDDGRIVAYRLADGSMRLLDTR